VVQQLSEHIARLLVDRGESIFRANARLSELVAGVTEALGDRLQRFGVSLENFNIERISIPAAELRQFQDVLGKRMEIDQISKATVGEAYRVMRSFDALDNATSSGGASGALATGFELATGVQASLSLGKAIGNNLSHISDTEPTKGSIVSGRLRELKRLRDD